MRLADNEGGAVQMVRGDGFLLPFADCQFDVVYSLGLIEHFESEKSRMLVAEHQRVCRKGGLVIVSVPNLLNLPHTLRKMILGRKYEYYPERSYTPKQLSRTLTSAGLRVKATDGLLPAWGIGMVPGGWRINALLNKTGIFPRLNEISSSEYRAMLGYMTYVVAEKP